MANDLCRTPKEIFNYFNRRYDFQCDVAASNENNLYKYFFTKGDSGLDNYWSEYVNSGGYVWCNPPYSKPLPWVQKVIEESNEGGIGTVMLLNCDMSTKWAKLLTKVSCEIIFITEGRIAFLDGEGKAIGGNNKSQMVIIIPPYVRAGEPVTRYLPLVDIMQGGTL
jgi:phage N-6-adenine-methyltransferase